MPRARPAHWTEDRDLPRKLRIGHRTIKVLVQRADEASDEGAFGSSAIISGVIRLDPTMGNEKAAEVLLHEIRHFLWSEWDLGSRESEEKVVTVLTRAEAWTAAQNPKVYRWIFRRLGVFP